LNIWGHDMAVARRTWLWTAAGVAGVVALGGAMALLRRPLSRNPIETEPALRSAVMLEARSLGREYLRLSPQEADPGGAPGSSDAAGHDA